MNSQPVPPATLRALAALALLLGLACAVVNGWFFALGLDRLEPDATVRAPLLLAGWLMVATEHVAVGLAALLPVAAFADLRRRLLWLGLALLAFECVSMFAAQRALEHSSVIATSAQTSHAAGLLGESGATALAAARALLIGVMGLVLMSAAGQLWAAGRTTSKPAEAFNNHPGSSPSTPTPQTAERPAKRPAVNQASGQTPPKRPPALRAKARDRLEHETQ